MLANMPLQKHHECKSLHRSMAVVFIFNFDELIRLDRLAGTLEADRPRPALANERTYYHNFPQHLHMFRPQGVCFTQRIRELRAAVCVNAPRGALDSKKNLMPSKHVPVIFIRRFPLQNVCIYPPYSGAPRVFLVERSPRSS